MNRADIHITEDGQEYKASEHSIGNLVLLYGKDNSEFGAKEFEDKKQQFFGNVEENIFYSRHLIHPMGTFANTKWNVKEIVEHKQVELANYDKQYEKYSK